MIISRGSNGKYHPQSINEDKNLSLDAKGISAMYFCNHDFKRDCTTIQEMMESVQKYCSSDEEVIESAIYELIEYGLFDLKDENDM